MNREDLHLEGEQPDQVIEVAGEGADAPGGSEDRGELGLVDAAALGDDLEHAAVGLVRDEVAPGGCRRRGRRGARRLRAASKKPSITFRVTSSAIRVIDLDADLLVGLTSSSNRRAPRPNSAGPGCVRPEAWPAARVDQAMFVRPAGTRSFRLMVLGITKPSDAFAVLQAHGQAQPLAPEVRGLGARDDLVAEVVLPRPGARDETPDHPLCRLLPPCTKRATFSFVCHGAVSGRSTR
jgi:hypothetical protein